MPDLGGLAGFWNWLILCTVLMVLEVLVPGVVFLWMAIAAALTAFILLAFPELSWQVQVLIFSVLSVASVVAGRMYQRRHPAATDEPALNRRGRQYVGRRFTLAEPIVNGRGELWVDDTTWLVEGPDLPVGAQVKVTGLRGTALVVERA